MKEITSSMALTQNSSSYKMSSISSHYEKSTVSQHGPLKRSAISDDSESAKRLAISDNYENPTASDSTCQNCTPDDFLGRCLVCRHKYYAVMSPEDADILLTEWLKLYFKLSRSVLEANFEKYGRFVLFIELSSFEDLMSNNLDWTLLPYYSIKDIPQLREDREFRTGLENWDVTFMAKVNCGNGLKTMKSMSTNLRT